jgi:hypothetical protein
LPPAPSTSRQRWRRIKAALAEDLDKAPDHASAADRQGTMRLNGAAGDRRSISVIGLRSNWRPLCERVVARARGRRCVDRLARGRGDGHDQVPHKPLSGQPARRRLDEARRGRGYRDQRADPRHDPAAVADAIENGNALNAKGITAGLYRRGAIPLCKGRPPSAARRPLVPPGFRSASGFRCLRRRSDDQVAVRSTTAVL